MAAIAAKSVCKAIRPVQSRSRTAVVVKAKLGKEQLGAIALSAAMLLGTPAYASQFAESQSLEDELRAIVEKRAGEVPSVESLPAPAVAAPVVVVEEAVPEVTSSMSPAERGEAIRAVELQFAEEVAEASKAAPAATTSVKTSRPALNAESSSPSPATLGVIALAVVGLGAAAATSNNAATGTDAAAAAPATPPPAAAAPPADSSAAPPSPSA